MAAEMDELRLKTFNQHRFSGDSDVFTNHHCP